MTGLITCFWQVREGEEWDLTFGLNNVEIVDGLGKNSFSRPEGERVHESLPGGREIRK